jgi:hypothetical protein
MDGCIYVCMYVCIGGMVEIAHLYMYVCFMYVCMYVCIGGMGTGRLRLPICICMYVCMYYVDLNFAVCCSTYVFICICMYRHGYLT